MPGFLIFEEFGDILGDMQTGTMADMAKKGLRMLPLSWIAHGVIGEFNVDIDPVAELRGDGAIAGAASGNVFQFYEAYKGWIGVVNVQHTIPGVAQTDEVDEEALARDAQDSLETRRTASMIAANSHNQAAGRPPLTENELRNEGQRKTVRSNMLSGAGVGELAVEVEIDTSLPKLIEWALHEEEGGKKGGKEFKVVDLHMCTTAQIDVSQLTLGPDNPATALIQTLVGNLVFNIIPYLSIRMEKVRIKQVDFSIPADATVPTANLSLGFKKVTWTYHIINGSNMNLFNLSFEYEIGKRKQSSELSLGGMVPIPNPFK